MPEPSEAYLLGPVITEYTLYGENGAVRFRRHACDDPYLTTN